MAFTWVFLLLWAASLFIIEGGLSDERFSNRINRLVFHLALYSFNLAACSLLFFLFYPGPFFSVPALSAGTVLRFLALDLMAYGAHYISHRVRWLWRFHKVHHSDDQLDVSTAFRENLGQTVFTAIVFAIGIYFLHPSFLELHFYLVASWGVALLAHANLAFPKNANRIIGWIFTTPNAHAVHHASTTSPIAANFGAVFSFWDRLFGTRFQEPRFQRGRSPRALTLREVLYSPFLGLSLSMFVLSGCTPRTSAPASIPPPSPQLLVEIEYGKELLVHTARYLGPKGSVAKGKSRMNCQNCHLNAGTKPYGISLQTAFGRYPEYKAREGKVKTLGARINDCFERAMNGNPIPEQGREMAAIQAYLRSLAQGIPVGERRKGDVVSEMVKFGNRAADSQKGKTIYETKCASCHGLDGLGKMATSGVEYEYPPVWGPESYNAGSNMNRVTKLAAFIRANMPFGVEAAKPTLSDEEAMDVAAYINNSRVHYRAPSPHKDYPRTSEKPMDFPLGPYEDPFTEEQHALGPYPPIMEYYRAKNIPLYY